MELIALDHLRHLLFTDLLFIIYKFYCLASEFVNLQVSIFQMLNMMKDL